MPRLTIEKTSIDGLMIVERQPIADSRGLFERMFCANELAAENIAFPVAQVNRTVTRSTGVVRGLHFQYSPHAETKLVSCIAGRVFDVAVDLRRGSSSFGRWHAEELSSGNSRSLLIPAGFAHGFQTLSSDCELLYLHSAAYAVEAEGGVHPCDPWIGIAWPLAITEVSQRDQSHPLLTSSFEGLTP